jgi:DNA-binding transcriptional LysR family regulator
VEDAVSVELRALRWAVIAAQHKSLRQAAETLNIRQSTLSRGLRDLEHRLGAILFERTNGGTRPTLAGEEFLDAARRIIKEAEAIAARIKMRSRGESGRLTIGVHASLSAGNLRATLIEHRRRFPEVHTHLVDGSSNDLISNLANSNRAGSTSIVSITLGVLGWLLVSFFNLRWARGTTFWDAVFSWMTFVAATCALWLI